MIIFAMKKFSAKFCLSSVGDRRFQMSEPKSFVSYNVGVVGVTNKIGEFNQEDRYIYARACIHARV
jgi:hypothetical protein